LALAGDGRDAFVPGVGALGDVGTSEARALVLDDDVHPLALISKQGPLSIALAGADVETAASRGRYVVTTRAETTTLRQGGLAAKTARLDVGVLVGGSTQTLWGRLYKLLRIATGKVTGVVTGTTERAHV